MKNVLIVIAACALLAGCGGRSVVPSGNAGVPGPSIAGHNVHSPLTATIAEMPIPQASSGPTGITAGPDGNVWFTEYFKNSIGMVNVATNKIKHFKLSTLNARPAGITAGPDGNLWFTESIGNKIGRITTAGVITEFPLTTPGSDPVGIIGGPDGNVWFTELDQVASQHDV
jgi:virginiamycin B lyase